MALQETIASIIIELQSRWERLSKTQLTQWTAYADFRLLSDSCIDARTDARLCVSLSARQYFILQNFYRIFYGPLNGLGKNPIMLTPIFAHTETMEIWGPKGEWSNKDIIRYPFPLNIKKHIAIIWESAPIPERKDDLSGRLIPEIRLMAFTTINGRDQDTTIPYREQFGRIPKAGEYIFAKVGFANKLTGVVSNFVSLKQKVTASR